MATLRDKLPAQEVDYAVEDALLEAGYTGGCSVGTTAFLVGGFD